MISAKVLAQIDALQLRYIRALDRHDMPGWAACFGEAGSYVCIARENEDQSLPIALMMDDNLERILDRVNYVTKVWVGTFEDYSTRHFVQRIECQKKGAAIITVESNFMITYTAGNGQSETLVAGVYLDEVVATTQSAAFKTKRAVLDTVVTPRYLVYPV